MDIIAISPGLTGESYLVALRETEGERAISIVIGAVEANAIAMRINNVHPDRPMTHDLMHNILVGLNVGTDHVCVRELNDGVFKSDIVLIQDSKQIVIDARTSDALALAVRMDCPIYVESDVLDEVIKHTSASAPKIIMSGTGQPSSVELQEELRQALENENYEEAARIRDLLGGKQL